MVAGMAVLLVSPALAQEVPDREPAPPPPSGTAPPPPTKTPTPMPGSAPVDKRGTYQERDVLERAEEVFGKGAKGLAEIVRDSFRRHGEPNGYIVGREGGGAFIVGLRYGSGTLYHKVEGDKEVHWTGPSLGLDVGGNADRIFALVYNLDDTEDLYRRYPAAEGKAYFVGGFTAHYLQRDRVIIVPIKLGAGLRLGINAGYMNFTRSPKVLPF